MSDTATCPPKEAAKQTDGSYLQQLEDGSSMRWTRRPDGTWRKPEHRRAGFVGELEQKAYVSKGAEIENNRQAAMQAQIGRVPGAPPGAPPGAGAANQSQASKSNERKKEKRAEKAEENEKARLAAPEAGQDIAADAMAEAVKNEKNIRKKLRQIEELEEKQKKGEELNEDQTAKLGQKKTLQAELKAVLAGEVVKSAPAPAPAAAAAAKPAAAAAAPASAAAAPAQAAPAAVGYKAAPAPAAADTEAGAPKNKKAIEKKLKQIAEIEEKQKSGDALNEDQVRKLATKKQLLADLKTAA